jgi:hypothetical protein
MGGTLRGMLRLAQSAEEDAWDLELRAAFTGVSGQQAVAVWRDLPADQTELDGVVEMRWRIPSDAETARDALQSLDLRLVITRIGSRALQGFLLALDPEERNPSFVSGRQTLRLGRPRRVDFRLNHGLMDFGVEVWSVATGAFYLDLIKRAALGEAFGLDALRPQLEGLLKVRDVLNLLDKLDDWATPPENGGPATR